MSEESQIKGIIQDAVGQYVNLSKMAAAKGKTELAGKMRAMAVLNAQKIKEVSEEMTEKLVNIYLGDLDKGINEGFEALAKTKWGKKQTNKIGKYITVLSGKDKIRSSSLDNLISQLDDLNFDEKKREGFNYIKSSLNNMKNKGYARVVQLDSNGKILAAAAMDETKDTSVHMDTFGSLGKGAGESVLYGAMRYSKDVAKRKGHISLYAVGDTKTIQWHEVHGFRPEPGIKDGRNLLTREADVNGFMTWFEGNKI